MKKLTPDEITRINQQIAAGTYVYQPEQVDATEKEVNDHEQKLVRRRQSVQKKTEVSADE